MPKIRFEKSGNPLAELVIPFDGLSIGAALSDDLRLPDWPEGASVRVESDAGVARIRIGDDDHPLDTERSVEFGPWSLRLAAEPLPERRLTRELVLRPNTEAVVVRETVIDVDPGEGAPRRTHALARGRTVVGKDAACDLVLSDAFVSARHLAVEAFGTRVHFRDLGSRNGVFQDDRRVDGGEWLPGRALTLGRTRLTLLHREHDEPVRESDARIPGLIGDHPSMRRIADLAQRAADTDVTVLIQGETGTGKELVARGLHALSSRRDGPFIPVNCSAVPRDLFESELFGHVKGAFSGAARDRRGLFAVAAGGTLFLDEIGELPLEVQARLLRVLDDRRIRPVGAEREVFVDVRVVAATHRDLDLLVEEGRFRRDLLFRLRMMPITLPPLRERRSDVASLARRLLGQQAEAQGKPAPDIDAAALERLASYDWPGNVRELQGVLARALILAGPGRAVGDEHLVFPGAPGGSVRTLEDVERDAIRRALDSESSREAAAKRLGIAVSTLYDKIKKYGLR